MLEDSEIQVIKVVEGEKARSGNISSPPHAKSEVSCNDDCAVVRVSVPKMMLPPRVVRVVGEPFMCGEVIDLTKAPSIDKKKSSKRHSSAHVSVPAKSKKSKVDARNSDGIGKVCGVSSSCDGSEYVVKDEDISPNQLGNAEACKAYDNMLRLGEYDAYLLNY